MSGLTDLELESVIEVTGTRGTDTLRGGTENNLLRGFASDDLLRGGAGSDTLLGGFGNDTLIGGAGEDVMVGGFGRDTVDYSGATKPVFADVIGLLDPIPRPTQDTLFEIEIIVGSRFNDLFIGDNGYGEVFAGGGNDVVLGLNGSDFLYGQGGNDSLDGGRGADEIWGGAGNDTLVAGAGQDVLLGGRGADVLWGDQGADALHGGKGADSLNGGGSDDLLIGGRGSDTLTGGSGVDAFQFVARPRQGQDVVTDFRIGRDDLIIEIGAFEDALTIRTDGDDILVTYEDSLDISIRLLGLADQIDRFELILV